MGKIRDMATKGVMPLMQSFRMDGWVNLITGLGSLARDKLQSTFFERNRRMTDDELESLFEDDIAAKIVEKLPEDALSKGFELEIKPDAEDPNAEDVAQTKEMSAAIMKAYNELEATPRLVDAWVWGRLFGGGGLYLITDDPGMAEDELDPDQLKKIRSLLVVDKRDLHPIFFENDPESPRFGEATMYQITRTGTAATQANVSVPLRVHWSRLIIFEGTRTTLRRKAENDGWSRSVLQRVNTVLMQFNVSWQGVAHLLTDSAQGVFKMQGLIKMIASGGMEQINKRMQVVDMGRSVARAVVLDAEKESFERQETTFVGQAQMMAQFTVRLSAAANMPATILMGQSPKGMDATGESDQEIWDDIVVVGQEHTLDPRLKRLLFLLMKSKDGPTKGAVPANWDVVYNALRQMTQKETAEIRKLVADKDKLEIDAGIVTAEEVTISRYGPGGYSIETVVSLELRKEVLEVDAKIARAGALPPGSTEPPPAQPPDTETKAAIALTGTAQAAIVTVNEARISSGLGPLKLPDGSLDPNGDLSIFAFQEKLKAQAAWASIPPDPSLWVVDPSNPTPPAVPDPNTGHLEDE